MLDIAMPKKIRLLALKTLLSAKLSEGSIIIVDNDDIPEKKTKHIANILENFNTSGIVLYISGYENDDFKVASKNIQRINYTTYDKISITDLLKHDKIIFNLDGILNLVRYIHEQTTYLHKPKAVKFSGVLTEELKKAEDIKLGKVPEKKVNFL